MTGRVSASRASERAFAVQVGDRIAKARKRRGWTQQELENASGVRQSTIAKIEKGHILVNAVYVKQMADALGESLENLLSGLEIAHRIQPKSDFPVLNNPSTAVQNLPPGLSEFLEKHADEVSVTEVRLLAGHSTQADPRLKMDDAYWMHALRFYREELARGASGGPAGASGKGGGGNPRR